jgi:hypothetical protein
MMSHTEELARLRKVYLPWSMEDCQSACNIIAEQQAEIAALRAIIDTAHAQVGYAVAQDNSEYVRAQAASKARTYLSAAQYPIQAQHTMKYAPHLLGFWELDCEEDVALRAAFEFLSKEQ